MSTVNKPIYRKLRGQESAYALTFYRIQYGTDDECSF